MRTLGVLQVGEYSLKERFEMKYLHQVSYLRDTYGVDKHHICLVFCITCICELPQDITMFMWTTIVHSLSQVADRLMSSPRWVDRAAHNSTLVLNICPRHRGKVGNRKTSARG